MATNLRLRPETEEALRAEAARTGRSQQDLIREAVDQALGLGDSATESVGDARRAAELSRRGLLPARAAFHELGSLIALPHGVGLDELLDRADRLP